uniref:Transcription factor n=1 Tax=Setaria italica TaxID=4555 RepID=K3YLT7_SETIT
MDGFVFPTSSSSSPSPASFSTAGHDKALQFAPCEVLGQGWAGNVGLHEPLDGAAWGDGGSTSTTTRGRKAGPARPDEPAIPHVEDERHRRDKLHRRFCELRAAVPNVSRMDKASILADATAYITELRGRVEQLEAMAREAAARQGAPSAASHSFRNLEAEKLEVRMVGPKAAALRLTTAAARHRHAPARLMDALRSLDLPVRHACICRVAGVTVQDAVVDVPAAALRDEGGLRAVLLHRLQVSG